MTTVKVKLVFETETEVCDTQYDYLHEAVSNLERALKEADSMDDLAAVFTQMRVDDRGAFPSYSDEEAELKGGPHGI